MFFAIGSSMKVMVRAIIVRSQMCIRDRTGGELILKIKKTVVSYQEAKKAIGSRPVYDITLECVKAVSYTHLDVYKRQVREDIVMAMEELELTDTQAQALWESPSPLADVYRYFEKLETGYMDAIRDSIENRADDVCRAKEELRTTPVYPHSAAYASEHGEMAQYNLSYQANSACKEAKMCIRDRG